MGKIEGAKFEIKEFVELVECAMKAVDKEFLDIRVVTPSGSEHIHRERVFCYELYHQMRNLQEKYGYNDFVINGEMDKARHRVIKPNFKPDMIVHKQGETKNYCVIEVKVDDKPEGIIKDFETIRCMLHCYRYQNGLFILVGSNMDDFKEKILPELNVEDEENCRGLSEHAKQIYVITYTYKVKEGEGEGEVVGKVVQRKKLSELIASCKDVSNNETRQE